MVYNETLQFDLPVQEGWNFIAAIVGQDLSLTRTRIRLYAASKMRVAYSVRTFTYQYLDDVDYDLLFGAKYVSNALNVTSGFTGFMLEIRLYSAIKLTTVEVDYQISKQVSC